MSLIDITGNTYNNIKVIAFDHIQSHRSYWKCVCTLCGKEFIKRKDDIIYPYSHSKSCGCWHRIESSLRPKNAITGQFVKLDN